MDQERFHIRSRGMLAILAVVTVLYAWVLFDLQVVNGSSYLEQSTRKIANSETVPAARGPILDRYGRVLVSNRAVYRVTLDTKPMGNDQNRNRILLSLLELCQEQGVSWSDSLPISAGPVFSFTTDTPFETARTSEDGTQTYSETLLWRLLKKLKPKELSLAAPAGSRNGSLTADQVVKALRTYFKVDESLSAADARALLGVLYELTLRAEDVSRTDYVFAQDVDIDFITVAKERKLYGVNVETVNVREYHTSYAAHILGRVGAIQNWDEYKDKGYSLSDTVGIGGVEEAFEDLLRGTPGVRDVELSQQSGKVVNANWHVDEETGQVLSPSPGSTVTLTLDIALQEAVEKALERWIPGMTDESQQGACVVVDMTGGVLASASYPTYDPASYSQDYNTLLTDPLKPLFNRALQGLYAPGSTFKPAVAAAALEEGVITPKEKIQDTGRYKHYDRIQDQPKCWIFSQYGTTHGWINVSEAIRDSCNVFFYETGLRLGISKLDEYAAKFGMGEKTGLELYERSGEVAGPDTSQRHGQTWYEGDTMYAAIGQGNTQVTPIQLANYVATLVNGGSRYPTHLLNMVRSGDSGQVIQEYIPQPLSELGLSEDTVAAVKKGMGMVVSEGSVAKYFKDCPVKVGAKTGTAQVTGSDQPNATLVAFAPYDDPQIAIALVVEKGGSGSAIAAIVAEIVNYYFSAPDGMDAPAAEGTLIK